MWKQDYQEIEVLIESKFWGLLYKFLKGKQDWNYEQFLCLSE